MSDKNNRTIDGGGGVMMTQEEFDDFEFIFQHPSLNDQALEWCMEMGLDASPGNTARRIRELLANPELQEDK